MKWLAVAGGSLQMLLTAAVVALIAYSRLSTRLSILAGILAALSSTVIALRLLHDRGQSYSPQGSAALAILIFQDIAVVPVMLFQPLLAGTESFVFGTVVRTIII
jgi:CPA2 family monovalent cation:H+ antiporter-2